MSKGTQAIFGTIPRFKKAPPARPSILRTSLANSPRSSGPTTSRRFTATASLPAGRRRHSRGRG
jgi:hypothetical protein